MIAEAHGAPIPIKLGTQAIGAAGELLVQYQLLKLGIDSARLTTDSGIDLVMYVPGHDRRLCMPTHHRCATRCTVPAGRGSGRQCDDCRRYRDPPHGRLHWVGSSLYDG